MVEESTDLPPGPHIFLAAVRRLAAGNAIRFTFHAEDERMEERDFDTDDVLETLLNGEISGSITPGKHQGEWKAKLVYQPFGTRRWMGVVTVVVRNNYLRIVTTEWEDRR